ncbi:MAG: hypothetical protein UDQ58_05825, partial [Desulfovibrio sp.]|nr:hypothetical protein [Desulfovibrio sp.]
LALGMKTHRSDIIKSKLLLGLNKVGYHAALGIGNTQYFTLDEDTSFNIRLLLNTVPVRSAEPCVRELQSLTSFGEKKPHTWPDMAMH